jgi:hypothetical protein
MSDEIKTWSDGEAVTVPELQRMGDSGAYADDRVLRGMFDARGLTGTVKRVVPLTHDIFNMLTATSRGQVARLVMFDVNSAFGRVTVKPAIYVANTVADVKTAPSAALIAHQLSPLDSPQIAANASGVVRYDTVYAAVQFVVSTTALRKVKTEAGVSTQSLPLAKKPQVTIMISQGAGGVPGALPADAGGVYYFALAVVAVAIGYTLGTALVDPTNATVTQTWDRAGIKPEMIQGYRETTWNGLGTNLTAESIPGQMKGHYRTIRAIKFASAAISGAVFADGIDFRGRLLKITMIQAANSGVVGAAYPDPTKILKGGAQKVWTSDWLWYGDGATGGPPTLAQVIANTFSDDAGAPSGMTISWSGGASGALLATWAGAFTANGGFHALVIVEYTDPFWLPPSAP